MASSGLESISTSGGGGSTAVTAADGALATIGADADAAVTGDNSGTVNAHLRGITKQLAGAIVVQENQYTFGHSGEFVPSAAATQLPNVAGHLVYVTARAANTGRIAIGGSGVTLSAGTTTTTAGYELAAGAQLGPLPVTNLNQLYAIATNSTDSLLYLIV